VRGSTIRGRYILDTNIISAILAGDESLREHLEMAEELYVPVIALGEWHYGSMNSPRTVENLARIGLMLEQLTVIPSDVETAFHYGTIMKALWDIGRPIPENDIWIAALAIQHDMTLVTLDEHMDHVTGMKRGRW